MSMFHNYSKNILVYNIKQISKKCLGPRSAFKPTLHLLHFNTVRPNRYLLRIDYLRLRQ